MFQIIALIPGVSRSAASIIGGLTQKLNKKTAAEFSFFLAVPTMFAATAYKMLKFYTSGGSFGGNEITLLIIGNAVAFIVAILAIKSFITFLTRHGFKLFGYYRIVVGVVILLLYYLGVGLTVV
jgi:undecaprenyl-diphosphatase